MASSIGDWAILRSLDSNFLLDVKTIATFNDSFGNYAFFIKENGDLYSIGKNNLGCLGLDDLTYTEVPVKVEHISGVEDVKCGGGMVVAYTVENKFYAWGGTRFERPEACKSWPNGFIIKQLAVSFHMSASHILILTGEGKVIEYKSTWASPYWRDTSSEKPTLHPLKDVVIVAVSCGDQESLALSENGEVYFWGWRGESGSTTPAALVTELTGKKCIKIACGMNHCLVLTEAGELYTWGQMNSRGELGSGDLTPLPKPTRLAADIGRFIDIATNNYCTSAAVREDGTIYTWGLNRLGLAVLTPSLTDCKELHQVFAKHGNSSYVWNYKPVVKDTTHTEHEGTCQ